jgi:excisionase family DNA binding protein
MEEPKKIFCSVWDHVIYQNHCLLEMEKVAHDNKTCAKNCVYYELLLRRAKIKEPKKFKSDDISSFYTTKTLAKRMGKTWASISYWVKKGEIPFIKVGPNYLFPQKEIEDWILNREKKAL